MPCRLLALIATVAVLLGPSPRVSALERTRHVQEYTVQHWNVQDGLPHDMVHAIAQDGEGFLWVATWEGVARFDGRQFTTFDPRNIRGLQSRGFRAITGDGSGGLLFGSSRNGVWQERHDGWTQLPGAVHDARTTCLLRAHDGTLWVGTEGGVVHATSAGVPLGTFGLAQGLRPPWVFALLERPDGTIWVASEGGLSEIAGGQLRPITQGLPSGSVRALVRLRDGGIVAAADRGLFRFDGTAFRPIKAFERIRVDALVEDKDGLLWANTAENGLMRWDGHAVEVIDGHLGLSGRATPALMEDHEGLLWVGTTDGLFRIADGPVTALDPVRGLSDGYARTVLATRDGSMWIGSGGGLDHWIQGHGVKPVTALWGNGLPTAVLALAETARGLWIGTADRGVFVLPPTPGQAPLHLDSSNGLPSSQVRALLSARDGGMWIGTVSGLAHVGNDGRLQAYGPDRGLPAQFVRAIAEMPDGTVWLGVADGVSVLHPDGRVTTYNRSSQPAFPADTAFDFHPDRHGNLWIGSDHGLVRFRDGAFSTFDTTNGLPNDSIFRVLGDAQDNLWLTSNRGVFRLALSQFDALDPRTRRLRALDVFDYTNGMPSSQSNGGTFPAGAMSADGKLWVPTASGVGIIDTATALHSGDAVVPVAITSVTVDGVAQSRLAPLRLTSTQSRRIIIAFTGLSFRNAGNLRYRYRLDGFDTDWVEADETNRAIYTNLSPGNYRFRVQAMVRPAYWAQARRIGEASLPMDLEPGLWQRPDVRVAGLMALLAAAILAWLARDRSHRAHQARLAGLVDARTRELSEKNTALEEVVAHRQQLVEQLDMQAHQDDLTGLPNRRAASERLDALCQAGEPVCVGLMDIDYFKRINDQHGHPAGDFTLQVIGQALAGTLHGEVECARLGGEEFALVFHGGKTAQAFAVCERLRECVHALPIRLPSGDTVRCTVSIGLSSVLVGASPSALMRDADVQLYRAKREGRNRTCEAYQTA